jgi:hypothetical protein
VVLHRKVFGDATLRGRTADLSCLGIVSIGWKHVLLCKLASCVFGQRQAVASAHLDTYPYMFLNVGFTIEIGLC